MKNNKSRRNTKKRGGRDKITNPHKLSGAVKTFGENTDVIAKRLREQEEQYFDNKKTQMEQKIIDAFKIVKLKIMKCIREQEDFFCEIPSNLDFINDINEQFPKSNANNKQRRKELRKTQKDLIQLLYNYLDNSKKSGNLTEDVYLNIKDQLTTRKITSSSSSSTRKIRKISSNK